MSGLSPGGTGPGRRDLLGKARRYVKKTRSRLFLDLGGPDDAIVLAGMARSGTTWAAQLLNFDHTNRILFEPFNPVHVKTAAPFKYIQYMDPACRHQGMTAVALKILAGDVRGRWVDAENQGVVFRRRIIKDIRISLMLRWLAAISPRTPIVLLVRHPLSVAASWLQLGWGGPGAEERSSDFEVLMGQPDLLNDFPVIEEAAARIDSRDPLQRIVFQWCVCHLVPFTQFETGDLNVVFYEDLVSSPERTTGELFRRLRKPYDWSRISVAIRTPSATAKSRGIDPRHLLDGWRDMLDAGQVRTATSILRMFGLDHVYTSTPDRHSPGQ